MYGLLIPASTYGHHHSISSFPNPLAVISRSYDVTGGAYFDRTNNHTANRRRVSSPSSVLGGTYRLFERVEILKTSFPEHQEVTHYRHM